MEFNPYKVLSLSKDASLEDIKKRYKKLARKISPRQRRRSTAVCLY